MSEAQLLADAISNAAPVAPSAGGVCVISDIVIGTLASVGRTVKVTGLGGSPMPMPVLLWSQTFDDRITTSGTALIGRRVYVVLSDRQPFIVDLAVSAPIVTTKVGG